MVYFTRILKVTWLKHFAHTPKPIQRRTTHIKLGKPRDKNTMDKPNRNRKGSQARLILAYLIFMRLILHEEVKFEMKPATTI